MTALSRWLWLPFRAYFSGSGGNFEDHCLAHRASVVARVYSLFRKRLKSTVISEVTPSQRWTMSILYFGLIAVLIFGMHVAQVDLHKRGVRAHGHGQDTLVQ